MELLETRQYTVFVQRTPFRRSTSVSIAPSGKIVIHTGKTVPQRALKTFLAKQGAWIEKQLAAAHRLKNKFPKKEFRNGEVFPYLGKRFTLRIVDSPSVFITFLGSELVFHRPDSMSSTLCFQRLKNTYKEAAGKILQRRVQIFSQKMQLFPASLQFRAQKTIWGSCSGDNKISLNWKLVVAPLWVLDYVVVHELAHIRHKDHSSRFWNLVELHSPHRKESRLWLRDQVFLPDFLSKTSELWSET